MHLVVHGQRHNYDTVKRKTEWERLGPDATEAAEFRIELGRLHHVLNHWLLFGAGYASQARRLADELSRGSSRTRP